MAANDKPATKPAANDKPAAKPVVTAAQPKTGKFICPAVNLWHPFKRIHIGDEPVILELDDNWVQVQVAEGILVKVD